MSVNVFSILVDQDEVVKVLTSVVSESKKELKTGQKMTNSWLFTGPAGSGRSNSAIAFAAALVCPSNGCNNCADCNSVTARSHADVEIVKTEGLSIRVNEIRDLIIRASWAPSVANYRVIVIEDADRLTDSAASALLKIIEEPGHRTVWLLCAPTISDVLPTIRSRCRHLLLRMPSKDAITKLLIERDHVNQELATFVARVSQGHIGVARHLAFSEKSRNNRLELLKLISALKDLNSAYKAAEILLTFAKDQAEAETESSNELELSKLKQFWGFTGSKIAIGGAKAVKELEKQQKVRTTRQIRDYIDRALLDIASFYRDVLLTKPESSNHFINIELSNEILRMSNKIPKGKILLKIESILKARDNLARNAAPLLTIEALMCELL
jgi:DNA polymerase III subunit delta'